LGAAILQMGEGRKERMKETNGNGRIQQVVPETIDNNTNNSNNNNNMVSSCCSCGAFPQYGA
jgi:hypothetical protein